MCDRETVLKGLDDKVYYSLGGDVGIVSAVLHQGKACDYLCAELVLTGKELVEFLRKNYLGNHKEEWIEDIAKDLNPDNRYSLTAYDW